MNKTGKSNGKLSEYKRDLPFSTPEGYFDRLEDRITDRLSTPEADQSGGKTRRDIVQLSWLSGVAAAIIAFLILLPVIFEEETPEVQKNEDLAMLLEAELYDLDGYELEYALMEQEVAIESEETEYDEELIQYLLDEDIELDLIVNEL